MTIPRALAILFGLSMALAPLTTASDVYTPLPDQRLTGAEDRFGEGVAMDGDVAAVLDDGGVTTWTKVEGTWSQTDRVTGTEPDALDIDRPHLVVRLPDIDPKGVLVYEKTSSGTWSLDQEVTSPADHDANFGTSAALDNDTLAVGADDYTTDDGVETGAVYTFQQNETGDWNHQQTLIPDDEPNAPAFGETVDLVGETLVVGAPQDDTPGHDSGSAYLFEENGGAWTQTTKLLAPDGSAGDNFGDAVATNGDTIAIGAWRADTQGVDQAGKVYLTTTEKAATTEPELLANPIPTENAQFGKSLDIENDTLLVGTPGDKVTQQNTGAAYAYIGSDTTWLLHSRLGPEDPTRLASFGTSMALGQGTALSGSPFAQEVLVYDGLVDGTTQQACEGVSLGEEDRRAQGPIGEVDVGLSVGASACLG